VEIVQPEVVSLHLHSTSLYRSRMQVPALADQCYCGGKPGAKPDYYATNDNEEPGMSESIEQDGAVSLPCRGCRVDCPDRKRCEGRPWRIPREQTGEDKIAAAGM